VNLPGSIDPIIASQNGALIRIKNKTVDPYQYIPRDGNIRIKKKPDAMSPDISAAPPLARVDGCEPGGV
jgi:hypothetical protein